jgi:hypothetical protein
MSATKEKLHDLIQKGMKQTAVEWLVNYIENQNKNGYEFHPKYAEHIIQQAKEMERQQGYSEDDLQTAFQLGRTYEYSNHESTNQLEIVQYLDSLKKAKKYE